MFSYRLTSLGIGSTFMKKFLLPLQNTVRADLFLGSLAVWNVRGEGCEI